MIASYDGVVDALMDMVFLHCGVDHNEVSSMGSSTSADAIRVLIACGKLEIIRGTGRVIVAQRVEESTNEPPLALDSTQVPAADEVGASTPVVGGDVYYTTPDVA